ncbi:MAG: MFS transporter [Deltaproteobacteria bacterium]|nr:MFS transporter [Deltaproteobacteria bacterium]
MESPAKPKKFAGIEVPPGLTRGNFFFLYLNTLIIGMLVIIPNIIQPAFLKDVIRVSDDVFGFTNGFLQNISQVATLAFVGIIGVLSDRFGRKILAIIGFSVLVVFYYLLGLSRDIATALHIPDGPAADLCAFISFMPSRAADFADFAPGLLVAYGLRLVIGIGMILCYPQFITMVSDYTHQKDRGKGMAFNGIMMGLASIIIFALIAPLGEVIGLSGLFALTSAMAIAGVVFSWFFLRERRTESKGKDKKSIPDLVKLVVKSPSLKATYLCSLIGRPDMSITSLFVIVWAVQAGAQLQMSSEAATRAGSKPMIVMSMAAFFAFPLVGMMLDRWGRIQTVILTLLMGGVGLMLLGVTSSPFSALTMGAVVLIGIGFAGAITGANTLATEASPKHLVGSVLGGLNTMQPIGVIFFQQLGGYLFDVMGPGWIFGIKGAANILLAFWLFMNRKNIYAEMKGKAGSAA